MAFEIERFKEAISRKNGLARNNLWKINLPLNVGGQRISSDSFAAADKDRLDVMCNSAQLPGRQITTSDRNIGLKSEKMATGFLKDDVMLSFYEDNDYSIRRYFESWQNKVVSQNTFEIKYKNEYAASVFIQQLDHNGNLVYATELIEAFPTTLNVIELNNDPNGLVNINVQLSYTNWK